MKRARSMLKLFLVLLLFAGLALVPVGAKDQDEGAREADDPLAAVVRIKMKAVPDARTTPFLGAEREGSGIVIDDSGHVLTIGYIVVEAESIEITTADGRTVPATLAGYDNASGFALLQASLPLGAKPMALGSSAAVEERDPVMVLPYGGRASASLAFVVSRREFSASWEYLVDSAIFT